MGSAQSSAISTQFNETMNKNVSSFIQNVSQSNSQVVSGTQNISISGLHCKGGVTISGITQKLVSRVNFTALQKAIDENKFQSMMGNSVKQAATDAANTAAHFMGPSAATDTKSEQFNKQVTEIQNSYSYSDFTNDMQQVANQQNLGIANLESDGPCNISNLSQTMYMDILAKNISDKTTSTVQKVISDVASKQQAHNTSATVSSGPISDLFGGIHQYIMLIIVAVVALVLLLGIIWFIRHRASRTQQLGGAILKGLQGLRKYRFG